MKRYAIIGGGIVGSTAAYYLARQGLSVTLYDWGHGQATKAAAGIICPWFSQRRNKAWYHSVANGAQTYRQLILDLQSDGFETQHFFKESGALLLRKNAKAIEHDQKLAVERRPQSPSMGQVTRISSHQVQEAFPFLETELEATLVQGGAHVNGQSLIECLQTAFQQAGGQLIAQKVLLHVDENGTLNVQTATGESVKYDHMLLSAGAWLPSLLEPLGLETDIRPQKGQLLIYENLPFLSKDLPVIMPPGEIDLIPFGDHSLIVGASHEDHQGYDLNVDSSVIHELTEQAQLWIPALKLYQPTQVKVGTRAYTSDYSSLIGKVPHFEDQLVAISGLGSSGLTAGPYLAKQWVQLMIEDTWEINPLDYPIQNYIHPIE